jgi:hypothetical protein
VTSAWFVETEDQLAEKISGLVAFQQLMGVATHADPQADALARVHSEIVERDEEQEYIVHHDLIQLRPFLLISSDPSIHRGASSNALIFNGDVLLLFEITKAQVADRLAYPRPTEAEIIRYVKNQCGLVVTELFEAWEGLNRSIEIGWRSTRNQISGEVPFCRFFFKFTFGPDE